MYFLKSKKIITFYTENDFMSNFFQLPIPIIFRGLNFHTSEALFMYCKAVYFGDEEVAEKISKLTNHPSMCKKLGRAVRNYDDTAWSSVRYEVMKNIVRLKLHYNEGIFTEIVHRILKEHGVCNEDYLKDLKFVETSPYDKIWGAGTGYLEHQLKLIETVGYPGQNLLGKCYDECMLEVSLPLAEIKDNLESLISR